MALAKGILFGTTGTNTRTTACKRGKKLSYGLLLRAPRGHGPARHGMGHGTRGRPVSPHGIPHTGYPGTARRSLPAALLPVDGAGDAAVSLGLGSVAAASGGGKGLPPCLEEEPLAAHTAGRREGTPPSPCPQGMAVTPHGECVCVSLPGTGYKLNG